MQRLSLIILITLLSILDLNGQVLIVEGEVLDSNSMKPLAFATIAIKGTSYGTTTNINGKFLLRVPELLGDSALVISYMGFKNYEIPVAQLENQVQILMEEDVFELDEIEVRPWSPYDYIMAAWKNVDENYSDSAYITTGYYSEYITENDSYLKFTEGVIDTYNVPYGDTTKNHSKLIQARTRKDIETLQFMRKRIDKRMEKEKRKAEKKGEEWEEVDIDEEIANSSFGGPAQILSADPIRDTAVFINPKLKKNFKYSIGGYTRMFNKNIIIIHFDPKGKYERQKITGDIYISLDDDAFIAFEFENRFIIPDAVRPLLFLFGFGITDPVIDGAIHYKPFNDKWYLNDISFTVGSRLTDKKMFKKNQRSYFNLDISMFISDFRFDNVSPFPKDERLDEDEPLEKQIEEDPEFWRNYRIARPVEIADQ